MLALMFMSYFEVIAAVAFFVVYVYETIAMNKHVKYEKTEEVTVPQKKYYKRLLINTLGDVLLIIFVLSVCGYFTTNPAVSIEYWYIAAAAVVKVFNRVTLYK